MLLGSELGLVWFSFLATASDDGDLLVSLVRRESFEDLLHFDICQHRWGQNFLLPSVCYMGLTTTLKG